MNVLFWCFTLPKNNRKTSFKGKLSFLLCKSSASFSCFNQSLWYLPKEQWRRRTPPLPIHTWMTTLSCKLIGHEVELISFIWSSISHHVSIVPVFMFSWMRLPVSVFTCVCSTMQRRISLDPPGLSLGGCRGSGRSPGCSGHNRTEAWTTGGHLWAGIKKTTTM